MDGARRVSLDGKLLAGRYRLGAAIGRGGMGKVWQAQDELLGRRVAVKELTAGLYVPEDERAVLQARMQQEARAAARINHPCVVTVHDVVEQDGRPWIVMELVDGRSLAEVVKEDGTLTPREAASVGARVLDALRAAHSAGVVHRDVKPGNVLLARDGRVLLTDFGIALIEGDSAITRTGELVGSVDYLAPERAKGSRPGPESDLWALGATLYTAVEGRNPFRRTSPISTLQAVVLEDAPESPQAGPLAPLIAALLRKEPGERPSAEEAARMLRQVAEGRDEFLAHTPTEPIAPVELPTRSPALAPTKTHPQPVPAADQPAQPVAQPSPAGPPRRRPRRTALVLALAVLLAGGAALGIVKYRSDHADGGNGTGSHPTATAGDGKNGDLPPGYVRVRDPAGFSLAVPQGWQRQTDGDQIDYTPDNGAHRLRIGIEQRPDWPNPYTHFTNVEQTVRQFPAYRKLRLHQNNFHGGNGALWEFTWTATAHDDNPGPRRAIDQAYRAQDGVEYAIYMSSPAADWTVTAAQFQVVLQSWNAGS